MRTVLMMFILFFISGCFHGQKVTHRDLGDAWPLIVEQGYVECEEDGALVFHYNGSKYALNATALKSSHYLSIESLRKKAPPPKSSKIPLKALVDVARQRCDG